METIITIFDDVGVKYYLIFQTLNGEWILPKHGINPDEPKEQQIMHIVHNMTGLARMSIKNTEREMNIAGKPMTLFTVEASMNSPINIPKDVFSTYLWATKERVMEKITSDEEKQTILTFESL